MSCQSISTLTVARLGWVTLYEVSGSSLPTSVSGCITSFPPLICMRDNHILQLSIMLQKTMQKTCELFFYGRDGSSEIVPSTSSEPVDIRLPTQEGKQTSQESASTRERLRSI